MEIKGLVQTQIYDLNLINGKMAKKRLDFARKRTIKERLAEVYAFHEKKSYKFSIAAMDGLVKYVMANPETLKKEEKWILPFFYFPLEMFPLDELHHWYTDMQKDCEDADISFYAQANLFIIDILRAVEPYFHPGKKPAVERIRYAKARVPLELSLTIKEAYEHIKGKRKNLGSYLR